MSNLKKIIKLYEQNEDNIDTLCQQFNIPLETALAVISVETNDDDGYENGNLIIRFEAHKFIKYCIDSNRAEAKNHFRYNLSKPWREQQVLYNNTDTFENYHGNQSTEYRAFEFAKDIDEYAAYMSISMGLAQIMGFNYAACGFLDVIHMYDVFKKSTSNQIEGMFEFFNADMRNDLRDGHYMSFAAKYNGKGKAEDYGNRIGVAVTGIRLYLAEK